MLSSAGGHSPALHAEWRRSSDDRPSCLENPRPAGAESTLTENVASPFHAEPRHSQKRDHIEARVSFSNPEDNIYDKNVQIAEINALNAALAVIKWKKLFGFYHDLEKEHHSTYEINVNKIVNDEVAA